MNKNMLFLALISMIVSCTAKQVDQNAPVIDPNRPHLAITLVYNVDVYQKPSFFLPKSFPSYAIWIEEQSSENVFTIYVTGKAGKGEWILADSRPESVPVWYGIKAREEAKNQLTIDAVSGATPSGEAAEIVWQVPQNLVNKKVNLYIEANSSFDYNDYYNKQKEGPGYSEYNGQPSLIWHTVLDLSESTADAISPEIIGHGHVLGANHQIYPDISEITTAKDTFQYVGIKYVKKD